MSRRLIIHRPQGYAETLDDLLEPFVHELDSEYSWLECSVSADGALIVWEACMEARRQQAVYSKGTWERVQHE